MQNVYRLVLCQLTLCLSGVAAVTSTGAQDRAYLVDVVTRVGGPVLDAFSKNQFKAIFPVRAWEKGRCDSAPLEAFTRTLAGMAPWLELGEDSTPEGQLREKYGRLARQALINATDPKAADYLSFGLYKQAGPQALVEAAYLSHALLRAPHVLWDPLTPEQKQTVLHSLKTTRAYKPYENNWVMFPAMVEAACWVLDGDVQRERIENAVKKHQAWYCGDGTYGDGSDFHWDYYNSYVMQPMLLELLRVCREKNDPLGALYDEQLRRAQRYAVVLERMISPEGTFPVIGRSSGYRFAAFQGLSQVILLKKLPADVRPGGARAGLTTVVRRMMEAPGTLDKNGWLDIGAVGRQPSIRDFYNNSGALYMCLTGLIHLGLPANDPFWQAPADRWTQQRIWAGEDVPNDHALGKP